MVETSLSICLISNVRFARWLCENALDDVSILTGLNLDVLSP